MKLKTLKDFKSPLIVEVKKGKKVSKNKLDLMQEWVDEYFISREQLRQEAIKWIKPKTEYLDKKRIYFSLSSPDSDIKTVWEIPYKTKIPLNCERLMAQVEIFVDFFNITDEDLK